MKRWQLACHGLGAALRTVVSSAVVPQAVAPRAALLPRVVRLVDLVRCSTVPGGASPRAPGFAARGLATNAAAVKSRVRPVAARPAVQFKPPIGPKREPVRIKTRQGGSGLRRRAMAGAAANPRDAAPLEALPVIAIVGRPNVGKSALFNRLVGQRSALVWDTPGGHVTRDHREGRGALGDLRFRLVDSAGLEFGRPSAPSLLARTAGMTSGVLSRATVALLVVDARAGIGPEDAAAARWLRRQGARHVVLVANKCEGGGDHAEAAAADGASLGLGDAVAVSAETGEGLAELYARLQPLVDDAGGGVTTAVSPAAPAPSDTSLLNAWRGVRGEVTPPLDSESITYEEAGEEILVAIIGRVNAGKSTLLNRLAGADRALTGPEPGLTRDPVRAAVNCGGRRVALLDTAGWAPRATMLTSGKAANLAAMAARDWLRRAHCAVLVVDIALSFGGGAPPLARAELALAALAAREGRCLVLAANKIDTIPPGQRSSALAALAEAAQARMPLLGGAPLVALSALNGLAVEGLLPAVVAAHRRWCTRIPTGRLNRWLAKATGAAVGAGATSGVSRVRYLTQVGARPPSFAAFVGGHGALHPSALRHLAAALRRDFDLAGVPIRIWPRAAGASAVDRGTSPASKGLRSRASMSAPDRGLAMRAAMERTAARQARLRGVGGRVGGDATRATPSAPQPTLGVRLALQRLGAGPNPTMLGGKRGLAARNAAGNPRDRPRVRKRGAYLGRFAKVT